MIDSRLLKFLKIAVDKNAPDLHLQSGAKPYLRIKDPLWVIGNEALTEADCEAIIFSTMDEEQRAVLAERFEVDYSFEVIGLGRFRANTFRAQGKYESVIRIIPLEPLSADELRLPTVVKNMALKPHGLILVAGTTGSGKSTTLAAMVNEVNRNLAKRIITIENPVEILHPNKKSLVSQREIGSDTKNFATAIRSAMRQDPNVILIGEIRDKETAETALQAAQTGHLVMSTIHASTVEELLGRFVSLFPLEDRANISDALSVVLVGALTQKLVEDVDGERLPALEVLVTTSRVQEAIAGRGQRENITTVIEQGDYNEMRTMDQALVKLVQEKMITAEVAMNESRHRQAVMQQLRNYGEL